DLARSGLFEAVPAEDMIAQPHEKAQVFFNEWRLLGTDYLVVGKMSRDPAGLYRVSYELHDVLRQTQVLQETVNGSEAQLRDIAHYIADKVYEKITGIKGAFSTKIAYVSTSSDRRNFRLIKADADGERAQTILESNEPILSPTWSPDGKQLAYVSFEDRRPGIYRQVIATGQRERLTNFPGLNSAPAWSPDGRRMAMVLSKDDNPEIYMLDLATRQFTRLTQHFAIDTEPAWMPDGRSLIFTSDRGGRPQIYQLDVSTLALKRLTYEGAYNARARPMPDGSGIVYTHRADPGGPFHIALQNFQRNTVRILTETTFDESPSIAPNGSMIIYATKRMGRGILAVVSVDANVKYFLPAAAREVREPAWAPYAR
ncbi:MAG: Tol-Pal system beta propeller repeat protein TolB, partial [Vulcanococcus sp.]